MLIKYSLWILTFVCSFISCETIPKSNPFSEENLHKANENIAVSEFRKLVDSTLHDSIDINTVLNFKMIDSKGIITPVSMEKAIELYRLNTKDSELTAYPIFEIKNSTKVILTVFGKGLWDKIWAKVVVDKKTLKILQVEFDHRGETPGLGAQINEVYFESQFVNHLINLEDQNYALYKDDEKMIDGKKRIDAITGATITSQGVIEMLNTGLLTYKAYLKL